MLTSCPMPSRRAMLTPPLLLAGVLSLGVLVVPLPRVKAAQPHPTIVVLGAAQYSGRPSPAFRRRLDHALALYRAGDIRTIVVTGGRVPGDPFTEGEVGVSYLRGQGVPSAALIAETRSRTTFENLSNARTSLPPRTPVTLVTDEAHAYRALTLARSLGLEANANPSPLSRKPDWRYLMREKLAIAAYSLLGVKG